MSPGRGTVILCVAASDAHAVANRLIELHLRLAGFDVRNLGTCTTVAELCAAADATPEAIAVLIGSVNGHVAEDLRELPSARRARRIRCPVVLGGNLGTWAARPRALGADLVVADVEALPVLLDRLRAPHACAA